MSKNGRRIRIFSALEVANICGVVNQTIINWIRNGYLKAFTTPGGQYRVYADDLSAFLDDRGMRTSGEILQLLVDEADWNAFLLVDADRDSNEILKQRLERNFPGFALMQAFDGFEAGQKLTESKPGFIFLDKNLPGIDGVDLARKIKEDHNFGKPFIIMIGKEDQAHEDSVAIAWADACFNKPLDFDLVVQTVKDMEKQINTAHTA
ncbi:MAG: response regulator [Treponema sp.]|nr:response regulator [Treponema sp.]